MEHNWRMPAEYKKKRLADFVSRFRFGSGAGLAEAVFFEVIHIDNQ